MTDMVGSLAEKIEDRNDNRDANKLIIEAIPVGNFGMSAHLVSQPDATKIRTTIAEALAELGITEEAFSAQLAKHYRAKKAEADAKQS
jgi:hypothetical protein